MRTLCVPTVERLEAALTEWCSKLYPVIREAVEYALLNGGHRIRPRLAFAWGMKCGGAEEAILPVAMAIELLHTMTLIQDDLPCMDDAKTRRGKPALFEAACVLGVISSGGGYSCVDDARRFGHALGMGYQLLDDAKDRDGAALVLGREQARAVGKQYLRQMEAIEPDIAGMVMEVMR